MAKSLNRQIDKVERKARLAGIHRQRELQEREFRNMHRMGWQEEADDEAQEIDEMAGWEDDDA